MAAADAPHVRHGQDRVRAVRRAVRYAVDRERAMLLQVRGGHAFASGVPGE